MNEIPQGDGTHSRPGSIQAEVTRLTKECARLTDLVHAKDTRIRALSSALRDVTAPALRAAVVLEAET
jgi:hypothetical protein